MELQVVEGVVVKGEGGSHGVVEVHHLLLACHLHLVVLVLGVVVGRIVLVIARKI